MKLDIYFDSEEKFIKIMERLKDKEKSKKIIEHELAHYRKALELGYSPIFLAKDCGNNYRFQVITLEDRTHEHEILIALAPQEPSEGDRKSALKSWAKIQERRYFLE